MKPKTAPKKTPIIAKIAKPKTKVKEIIDENSSPRPRSPLIVVNTPSSKGAIGIRFSKSVTYTESWYVKLAKDIETYEQIMKGGN